MTAAFHDACAARDCFVQLPRERREALWRQVQACHVRWHPLFARRDGAADGVADILLRSHSDSKAEVQDYITKQNIPASFIMPSGFMTNLSGEQALKPSADGSSYNLVTFMTSGKDYGFIDIEADFGPLVVAMLKNRDLVLGKTVPATMFATIEDFANGASKGDSVGLLS
jgi:hypothetical protein